MSFVSIQNAAPLAYSIPWWAGLLFIFVIFVGPLLHASLAIALSVTAYGRNHPRRSVIVTTSLLIATALLSVLYSVIYLSQIGGWVIFLGAPLHVVAAATLIMIAYMRNSLYKHRVLLISALTTAPLILVVLALYLFHLLELDYGGNIAIPYYELWFMSIFVGLVLAIVVKFVALRRLRASLI